MAEAPREPIPGAGPTRPAETSRIDEAVAIVEALCGPLDYLHANGLVHADLKPDNVLLGDDGLPVLVDLGLAALTTVYDARETVLHRDSSISGTVAYMSPEQVRGELLDGRSDLYAIGCLLYRLLAGRPPFSCATAGQTMRAHLRDQPAPPSSLNPAVSAELDAIVVRLLAKRREDRFGFASDLSRALGSVAREPRHWPGAPPQKTYLHRPAFAGRTAEIRFIKDSLGKPAGPSQVVLVNLKGPAGSGKTRLALEYAVKVADSGTVVLFSSCEQHRSQPLGGFVAAIRELADRFRLRPKSYEPAIEVLPGVAGAGIRILPPSTSVRRSPPGCFPVPGRAPGSSPTPALAGRMKKRSDCLCRPPYGRSSR
ncbi:MAG: serine/threonine-protein kinase PknK [Candidatus Schekmanbacteria bacterium]|nr:serine/threonine-protein kinase PknK [Candidatus Schekmanbacteria bacterium]